MNNANLQSLMSLNSAMITILEETLKEFLRSAKINVQIDEKAFAIEDYKQAEFYRKKLAIRVRCQHALKAAMAENNNTARIRAKGVRMFGAEQEAILATPSVTSVEIEAALDEALAIKFPKKADTRPADHPSFLKAKKAA